MADQPVWTAHKSLGVGSGATHKNRTSKTRHPAQSIRDVAFEGRREFVAEARPRSGSGGQRPLVWTQPSARQAQVVGQTTWRICSFELAAEEREQ